jgi:hypothetical protein
VNVATELTALYATVPCTEVFPGPVRVKVEPVIVAEFIV